MATRPLPSRPWLAQAGRSHPRAPATPSRLFLLLSLCLLVAAADRPNVLFIVCDDLNNDLGCYGAKVHSPAVDALAKRAVRFERAYCQYPLCNPSRASFMTGLRPDRTQVFDNAKEVRKQVPGLVTMPQAFRAAGYRAVRIGKLYHYGVPKEIGTNGLDDAESWDAVINPKGKDKEVEARIHTLTPGQFGGTLSWLAVEGRDEEFTDGIAADAAIAQLQELKDKPFFLAVGFYRPHTPFVAPLHWFGRYPLDEVVLHEPRLPQDNPPTVPKAALASAKKEQHAMTDEQRRAAVQAYHASISHMDSQLARVLEALDGLGLAKNTVVVFTSDHGYLLGQHGLWQKQSLFDPAIRVPLLIAGPGVSEAGKACGRPVELTDLFPTLAELCRVPTPAGISGRSLAPLLTDVTATVRTAAFSMVRGGRSIRTERWRYTEWNDGKEGVELYDHERDPGEMKNLANDPAHAATVAEMKVLLANERGR
jgi:choline-sulfatase